MPRIDMQRIRKEKEEVERKEVIDLLRKQMKAEGELIGLYGGSKGEVESKPIERLLYTIQLDSRKHAEICQVVLDVLEGEDILKPEKRILVQQLQRHIDLEKESVDRLDKILKNIWIKENKGLSELIKRLREDEKRHHNTLKKLRDKPFFRLDPYDWGYFHADVDIEERYKRGKAGRAYLDKTLKKQD